MEGLRKEPLWIISLLDRSAAISFSEKQLLFFAPEKGNRDSIRGPRYEIKEQQVTSKWTNIKMRTADREFYAAQSNSKRRARSFGNGGYGGWSKPREKGKKGWELDTAEGSSDR